MVDSRTGSGNITVDEPTVLHSTRSKKVLRKEKKEGRERVRQGRRVVSKAKQSRPPNNNNKNLTVTIGQNWKILSNKINNIGLGYKTQNK